MSYDKERALRVRARAELKWTESTGCVGPSLTDAALSVRAPLLFAAAMDELAIAEERLGKIATLIEAVDVRCMAADGPVTATLKEMTQGEISAIYAWAKGETP